ncbi:MAG: hypothetical protein ABSA11_01505 [Candidatus Bathyarchaeia archaeon]|jgi:hypothetical protein
MKIIYLSHLFLVAVILVSTSYVISLGGSTPSGRFNERAVIYALPACACRVKTITVNLNNTGQVPIMISEIIVNGTSITSHNFPPDHMEITTDYMFDGKPIQVGESISFKLQIGSGLGETTIEISVVSESGISYTTYAHLID